ncbi:MAG: hypothetical protein ABIV26_09185 [Candidatus Limnocylindrales bacterium]
MLLIIGWGIAAGFVFAVVGGVLNAVLGNIPVLGTALATAIGSAFGFGSSVTIYRKVTAPEGAAVPVGEVATPAAG